MFCSCSRVIDVTREHAKGDVALRGAAGDVLLVLWGRMAIDDAEVDTFGSDDVLRRLLAVANL